MSRAVVPVEVFSPIDDWRATGQWEYDTTDPYAVTLSLFKGSEKTVSYTFGRDLLEEGLNDSAGELLVIVEPVPAFPIFIAVTVTGPNGYPTLFHIGRDVTVYFLSQAYSLVPQGREGDHLDVDSGIAELLGGAS